MKNYFTYNFTVKTIIGSKSAISKANAGINSQYKELCAKLAEHPDFKVIEKQIRQKPNKKKYSGLTLKRMEEYIKTQPDSDKKMKDFKAIQNVAETALMCPYSTEREIIERCCSLCPNLHIAYRTHRSPQKANAHKGITYKKMENYIRLFDNADELLKVFYLVKSASRLQKNSYQFVYNWFSRQFPRYRELPEIKDGKLNRVKVIDFPIDKQPLFVVA